MSKRSAKRAKRTLAARIIEYGRLSSNPAYRKPGSLNPRKMGAGAARKVKR